MTTETFATSDKVNKITEKFTTSDEVVKGFDEFHKHTENITKHEDVDKCTEKLEYMKDAVVKIRRKDSDKFEGQSKGSTGRFILDSELIFLSYSKINHPIDPLD